MLTTPELDNLNQFGALVTNGQEELARFAYLVTIALAEANRDGTRKLGETGEHRASPRRYPTIRPKSSRHPASTFPTC